MKQFAIIGAGAFGKRVLEEMIKMECEIILIDKNKDLIDLHKDDVSECFVADVINEETIKRLIPETIDGVVIDLGERVEVSILVTNYLKKMGLNNIYVKAETDSHGEILEIVGADNIIFPNLEAAQKITPMLMTSDIFNYMPISNGLVMAEVQVPKEFIGKTLIDANVRKNKGVNVVAVRKNNGTGFRFFYPDHMMEDGDIFLVVGREEDIVSFAGANFAVKKGNLTNIFSKLFGQDK